MKFRHVLMAGVILAAIATQSCKKEENKTAKDALLDGIWHVSSATVNPAVDLNGDGVEDTDALGTVIQACNVDDTYDFQDNNIALVYDNTDRCSASTGVDTSYWSLNTDQSIFTLDILPLTVVSHTNTSFVVSSDAVVSNSTLTVTFSKN